MSIRHFFCASHLTRLILVLGMWLPILSQTVSAAGSAIKIDTGAGSFSFVDEYGPQPQRP